MRTIGSQVRARRQELGVSLSQLALRAGVAKSHLSLIEKGRAVPGADILERLAGELGTTAATLTVLAEPPPAKATVSRRNGAPADIPADAPGTGALPSSSATLRIAETAFRDREVRKTLVELANNLWHHALDLRCRNYVAPQVLPPLKQALALAELLDEYELQGRLLAELAGTTRQHRDFSRARTYAQRLLELSTRLALFDGKAALEHQARAYYELGRLLVLEEPGEEALQLLKRAETMFHNDVGGEHGRRHAGWSLYAQAHLHRRRGHIDDAIAAGETALDAFRKLENAEYALAAGHQLLGFCYRIGGNRKQAEAHLNEARRISQEHRYTLLEADTLLQLGLIRVQALVEKRSADLEKDAALNLEASWLAFERLNHPTGTAHAIGGLGSLALSCGDIATAKSHFSEALGKFRDAHDGQGQAWMFVQLGAAFASQDDYSEAADCFREAAALYDGLGNDGGRLVALIGAAATQAKLGDAVSGRASASQLSEMSTLAELQDGVEYELVYPHILRRPLEPLFEEFPGLRKEIETLTASADVAALTNSRSDENFEWRLWASLPEPHAPAGTSHRHDASR
jgi:transcriptional regulator with XRE-family HTH domain